jgi:hypothetical protein
MCGALSQSVLTERTCAGENRDRDIAEVNAGFASTIPEMGIAILDLIDL